MALRGEQCLCEQCQGSGQWLGQGSDCCKDQCGFPCCGDYYYLKIEA